MGRHGCAGVDVEEGQVVELLQHEVAGIVQDIRPGMPADCSQEAFEGDSIMQVFARMISNTDRRLILRKRRGLASTAAQFSEASSTSPAGRCRQGYM